MSDGNVHTVRIAYTPGTMQIYLDDLDTPALTVSIDLESLLNLDNGTAWVGFTASTWNGWENHDILNWYFAPAQPPSVPTLIAPVDGATITTAPVQLQLSATDPNNDQLKFKVELLQNNQVVRTFDQTQDNSGWSKRFYRSGETAILTISQLSPGIYQWRAQAFDGVDWGAVSETRTFTFSTRISFDNTHILFDEVNVTIRELNLQANTPPTPKVSLIFPVGKAASSEIPADAVTVSEDGTQLVAKFHLLGKVISPAAPTVRLQHASVGELTWQGPVLDVPKIDSELSYNKTFLRLGREERFAIQVTNQHSFPENPLVMLDFSLENLPSGVVAHYRVLDATGQEVGKGVFRPGQERVPLFLPPIPPFATATFTLLVRVAPESRAHLVSRQVETIAIAVFLSAVTVLYFWIGSELLSDGCAVTIKHAMKVKAAEEGVDLSPEQIDQMYDGLKRASSFAKEWLNFVARGATEIMLKEFIKENYPGFEDLAGIAYKIAQGEPGALLLKDLILNIVSKILPGFDWFSLPARAAVEAFTTEAIRCLKEAKEAQILIDQVTKENKSGRLRVTGAWDPNAKGGSLGIDGFVAGDFTLTYTVSFENLSTATAAAEEVLLEDVLQSDLDLDSLTFTGFSVGGREVALPEGTKQLTEDIDLRPAKNLVIQVRSRLDPTTRKLTITFKGIDPATGQHHPDGFLPPNANPPEGEGYVTFRIRPKADAASGTVIKNKATIVFDPHLGVNPPMDTNEYVLTLDKQPPTVRVVALPSEHPLPSFPVPWEGSDDASGIARTEIWFSENGGPFQLWETLEPDETRQVSGRATFKGKFGYEYRFYAIARDKVGNQQPHPDQPQATTRAGTPPRISAGLKMVTLPIISEIADPKEVFAFDGDKWAWYDPATKQYVNYPAAPASTMQVGKGFWTRFSQEVTPNVKGDLPDDTQPFVMYLKGGSWNLIGNPWLVDLLWDINTIQVQVNGQRKVLKDLEEGEGIEPYAWRWDGSNYRLVYDRNLVPNIDDAIPVWEGCWVFAHQDCRVILPPPSEQRARSRASSSQSRGWSIAISAETGSDSSEVVLGVSSSRALAVERPPDPPTGKPAVRLFLKRGEVGLATDIRRSAAREKWELEVEVDPHPQGREVTLRWRNASLLPRSVHLVLIDPQTGTRRHLRSTASYTFRAEPSGGRYRFQVELIPTSQLLRITNVSVQSSRGGQHTLSFSLTSEAQVEVQVLGLNGQAVRTLMTGTSRSAGMHSVVWDGRNQAGVALPPGQYMITIRATTSDGQVVRATVPVVMAR